LAISFQGERFNEKRYNPSLTQGAQLTNA